MKTGTVHRPGIGLAIGVVGADETVVGAIALLVVGCLEGVADEYINDTFGYDLGDVAGHSSQAVELVLALVERFA